MPFNAADLVTIKGDVNLTYVHVYPGMTGQHGQQWHFQMVSLIRLSCLRNTPCDLLHCRLEHTSSNEHVSWYDPSLHHESTFMNLLLGRVLHIQGTPNGYASRFEFNLLTGLYDGADVAFHFNPRFDQREAVRNSCQGGGWGGEEKQGGFPLQPGQPFDLQIICFPEHYQVSFLLPISRNGYVIDCVGEFQWSTMVHLSSSHSIQSSSSIASQR